MHAPPCPQPQPTLLALPKGNWKSAPWRGIPSEMRHIFFLTPQCIVQALCLCNMVTYPSDTFPGKPVGSLSVHWVLTRSQWKSGSSVHSCSDTRPLCHTTPGSIIPIIIITIVIIFTINNAFGCHETCSTVPSILVVRDIFARPHFRKF